PSNQKATFVLRSTRQELANEQDTIARLLNASELTVDSKFQSGAGTPVATTALGEILLVVQVDRGEERQRLDKEIAKVEAELRTVDSKLANKSFIDRAPKSIVEDHRQRKGNFTEQLKKLKEARARL